MRNIKKLSKKYNLSNKLSNKLLINKIKKLEILHKKAKKLNIKITKKNKKKQRIYKTEKQLVKEIEIKKNKIKKNKIKKNKFGVDEKVDEKVDDKLPKVTLVNLHQYETIEGGVGKGVNSLLSLTAANLLDQGITQNQLLAAGYPSDILHTVSERQNVYIQRQLDYLWS